MSDSSRGVSWLEEIVSNPRFDHVRFNFDPTRERQVAEGPTEPQRWMDYADLMRLGGFGRSNRTTSDRIFDRERDDAVGMNASPYESETGTEQNPFAYRYIRVSDAMGNPVRPKAVSPHEAGLLLWQRYREILERRDMKTVQLVSELARTGNDLLKRSAQIRTNRPDAQYITIAPTDDYSVVATTRPEARLMYLMTRLAVDHYGHDQPLKSQQPVGPSNLPTAEMVESWLKAVKPPAFERERDANLVAILASNPQAAAVGAQTFGRIALGAKQRDGLDLGLLVRDGSPIAKVIPDTKTAVNKLGLGAGFQRQTVPVEGRNGERRADDLLIRQADQTIVIWNGDARDPVLELAAEAQRRGKLLAAYDHNGVRLNEREVAATATSLYPSMAEMRLSESLERLNVPAAAPLSQYVLEHHGHLDRTSIQKLAATDLSIREIVVMAQENNAGGREQLYREFGVVGATLDHLGGETAGDNVKKLADNLALISRDMEKANVQAIAGDMLPITLQSPLSHSARLPGVLFVQGSNDLARLGDTVAVIGDRDMHPVMKTLAGEASDGALSKGAAIVQVEGIGPSHAPTGPSILILSSGHDHLPRHNARLSWAADRQNGQSVATAGDRTYVISKAPERPTDMALIMKDREGNETRLETLRGPNPDASGFADQRRNMFQRLKTRATTHLREELSAPHVELRAAVLRNGGTIVSALPPTATDFSYSRVLADVVGVPTVTTEDRSRRAIELAAGVADRVVLTQISHDGLARHALPIALGNKSVERLVVPTALRSLPELSGNRAIMDSKSGGAIAERLGLGEQTRIALEERFPKTNPIRGVTTPGYHQIEETLKSRARTAADITREAMSSQKPDTGSQALADRDRLRAEAAARRTGNVR